MLKPSHMRELASLHALVATMAAPTLAIVAWPSTLGVGFAAVWLMQVAILCWSLRSAARLVDVAAHTAVVFFVEHATDEQRAKLRREFGTGIEPEGGADDQ